MRTKRVVRVALGARRYEIHVGRNLLPTVTSTLRAMKHLTNVMVVTSPSVVSHHIRSLHAVLIPAARPYEIHLLPDGEEAKSVDSLLGIYHHLLRFKADRGTVLIAFGGGTVGDVAGFAASTFMRGIRWIQIPTTLLGQVDSAIGGKTAINLEEGKNLVGAFYQPSLVVNDIALLRTLPHKELSSSLAEVIKYGMIKGESFFRYLETHMHDLTVGDERALEYVVAVSADIKARIVSRDEHETSGLRMHLNLGHTFAHAFERCGDYRKISHGRAVAVGLLAATRLSEETGILKKKLSERLRELLRTAGLPVSLADLGLKRAGILAAMEHDKKKRQGTLRFVLLRDMGRLVVRDDIQPAQLKKIIAKL